MKKLLTMLMIAGLFGLVACGSGNDAEAEAEAAALVEGLMNDAVDAVDEATEETAEALVAHECGADCTEEGCSFKHGEEGHECTDACSTEEGTEEGAEEETTEEETTEEG